ncbi:hypothetical protein ACCS55_15835 [Rhizobium ruizarguesonis]
MADGNWDRIIKDHIAWLADGANATYFGPETALLAYGKSMLDVRSRPVHLAAGQKRQCYANCVRALLTSTSGGEELFYVEGYATDKGGQGLPIQHAWLLDSNGRVIDPTWENSFEYVYFGVVFKSKFVMEMLSVADMVPGILSTPVLMRRHFGTRSLFEAALERRHHHNCRPSNDATWESAALQNVVPASAFGPWLDAGAIR